MSNVQHVPMRMCAITREKLPKKELLRFVFVKERNEVCLDKGERLRGRGINLKPDIEVFDQAIKRKLFERTFGINGVDFTKLREEVGQYIDEKFREKQVIRVKQVELDKLKGN